MTSDHKVKINEIANEMFQIARDLGFHREETVGQIPDNFGAWCANLHSEVSESALCHWGHRWGQFSPL